MDTPSIIKHDNACKPEIACDKIAKIAKTPPTKEVRRKCLHFSGYFFLPKAGEQFCTHRLSSAWRSRRDSKRPIS